jgi:uncharacterized cofD-like protein
MKRTWQYQLRGLMLPGLKRWIVFIGLGIFVIVFGVFLLLDLHPVDASLRFTRELLSDATRLLPSRFSGLIALAIGGLLVAASVVKITRNILGAYFPEADRESIPDVLYRKRHLERGPRVVVVGGGTGLSTLLRGLKGFTHNITAVVTVGDDGGSSGRLRQELGVLPPGDLRNCITALADEDKLVTELFRYRFERGDGLEGHSFGNLFLTAVSAITNGDMLEAARVASRVLNSCGQVLPSTSVSMTLLAEFEDGRTVRGESMIPENEGKIRRVSCEPDCPIATPEALEAIKNAEMIVLGPGSLYTSIVPNLLVKGIAEAIADAKARKIYVCNVMTQKGETIDYTVADHVAALLQHAGFGPGQSGRPSSRLLEAVMVNGQPPVFYPQLPATPVRYDPERLKELGVRAVVRPLCGADFPGHHDPTKLAQSLMLWYFRQKPGRSAKTQGRLAGVEAAKEQPAVEEKTQVGSSTSAPTLP